MILTFFKIHLPIRHILQKDRPDSVHLRMLGTWVTINLVSYAVLAPIFFIIILRDASIQAYIDGYVYGPKEK